MFCLTPLPPISPSAAPTASMQKVEERQKQRKKKRQQQRNRTSSCSLPLEREMTDVCIAADWSMKPEAKEPGVGRKAHHAAGRNSQPLSPGERVDGQPPAVLGGRGLLRRSRSPNAEI